MSILPVPFSIELECLDEAVCTRKTSRPEKTDERPEEKTEEKITKKRSSLAVDDDRSRKSPSPALKKAMSPAKDKDKSRVSVACPFNLPAADTVDRGDLRDLQELGKHIPTGACSWQKQVPKKEESPIFRHSTQVSGKSIHHHKRRGLPRSSQTSRRLRTTR